MSLRERMDSFRAALADLLADSDAQDMVDWIGANVPQDSLTTHEAQILGVLCGKLVSCGVRPEVVGTYIAVSMATVSPATEDEDGGEGDEDESDPSIPAT